MHDDIGRTIEELNEKYANSTPEEVLSYFYEQFRGKLVFSSSMGAEDQVITDMIVRLGLPINIFTLETGRLFPETYRLIEQTCRHYNIRIKIFFPDYKNIENMVQEKGINLFYDSIENRKLCCHVRKVEPLKRALSGFDAWMTGIRKDQTIDRFYTKMIEWDESHQLIKISPLHKWTEKMVWDYIRKNNVPYNELHDKGFPSIGCQPCTRSVQPGDDPRSGRWWWEKDQKKECGIHSGDDLRTGNQKPE